MTEISYRGPAIDDTGVLERLPVSLRRLLQEVNGYIQFGGGLHVRGICAAPDWHSLQWAWTSKDALHRHYPALTPEDIPFGQDCVGDQFLLRSERVIRLQAETGTVEDLGKTLEEFLAAAQATPLETLGMHPLLQFQRDGGVLKPGELLSVAPPFCVKSKNGVSLRAIPAIDRILFLADFSSQIADVPDGGMIIMKRLNDKGPSSST